MNIRRMLCSALPVLALGILEPGAARGQAPVVRLEQVFPLGNCSAAVNPPGDPTRLFATNLSGQVRIYDTVARQLLTQPFATLTSTGGANGITSLAFHPRYASNGFIYVWTGIAVERIRAQGDPSTATVMLPGSRTTVLRISTLTGQHVGGWIGFGPDGMLWVSTGDAHNSANGQRIDNLMGRILRIDVDGADNIPGNADDDGFPDNADKNYAIPADNPFVGIAGEDEIWAYGLRNPFKCSFDALTGDLWIGDVGEVQREEIDYQPAHLAGTMPGSPGYTGGRNYGWRVWEGTRCNSPAECGATPQTGPVAEYGRENGLPPLQLPGGNTVIGGYVYRGCEMPELYGWYIFGDGGYGRFLWAIRVEGGAVTGSMRLAGTGTGFGFAQDLTGEMYVCNNVGLFRIRPNVPAPDADGNGIADSCEPGCGGDFNADGLLNPDDLSEFITCFFLDIQFPGLCPASDFNGDTLRNPDDLSEFITTFFLCL
jgi:hypothetical protein